MTAPAPGRLAEVARAVEAMRKWRDAPAAVAPVLAGLTADPAPLVRVAAVRALAGSLTATRLTADLLAARLDEPDVATALGSVGDRRAVPPLIRLLHAGADHPRLGRALAGAAGAGAGAAGAGAGAGAAGAGAAGAGADSAALTAAARQVLAADLGPAPAGETWRLRPAERAMYLLAAIGPGAGAAVPDLIARIEGAIDRGDPVAPLHEIEVLGRIGPAAAAAVPLLRRYATAEGTRVDQVLTAVLMITQDRAVADRVLADYPEELRRKPLAATALTWLAGHGGLTGRQHRQLRHLFARPGVMQVGTAEALWRHEGPRVAGELIAELQRYLTCDWLGPKALRVLGLMGTHARPLLSRLDDLAHDRRRVPVNDPDPDSEMRADEELLAALTTARDRIAAGQP